MTTDISNTFSLTKQDTAILKGIAIIAMLCHHLYCCPPENATPCSEFLQWIGGLGKFCVAMFVFCSGYGLSAQYSKRTVGTLKFMLKRFAKFYANYWVIFLIFVPLTVFCFGRPLSAAYGEHVNIPKHLILDLLGIQGFNSYNITWWFNKLILILYLLFPIVYWCCRKNFWVTLSISFVAFIFNNKVDFGYTSDVMLYLFPFTMGIVWSQQQDKLKVIERWYSSHKFLMLSISLLAVASCTFLRMNGILPKLHGIRMDAFLSISIAVLIVSIRSLISYTPKILPFLGTHSANIYLTHTFFYVYFPTNFLINCTLQGGVRFAVLLTISLSASIVIEFIKKKTKYNAFIHTLIDKISSVSKYEK